MLNAKPFKVFRILFIQLIIAVSLSSYAEDTLRDRVDLRLPDYTTLRSFNNNQLETYLQGLRLAATDMSALNQSGSICNYAGWPMQKSGTSCPRPQQKSCSGENFECPLIYGSVCVGYGTNALSSCEASAPTASELASRIRSDSTGTFQSKWNDYSTLIQQYCDTGAFRGQCNVIRSRVTEARQVAGVSSRIPAPAVETYTQAGTISTPAMTNTSLDGNADACYSESLVQSSSCGESRKNVRLMPAEVAFRAFCQEDIAYLESQIGGIRARANEQLQCLRNREKQKGLDRYQKNSVKENRDLLNGMIKQLERCYRYVKGGGKIPSRQLGNIIFSHETPGDSQYGMVELETRAPNGQVSKTFLQAGYTGMSLNLINNGGRFCDYDLGASSAPSAREAPVAPNVTTPGSQ